MIWFRDAQSQILTAQQAFTQAVVLKTRLPATALITTDSIGIRVNDEFDPARPKRLEGSRSLGLHQKLVGLIRCAKDERAILRDQLRSLSGNRNEAVTGVK
jgi:hypothetical protein